MAQVALVIPVLNGANFLQGLLDSLKRAWDERISYIYILDNASNDDTADVAMNWITSNSQRLKFKFLFSRFSENKGFGPAVNIGIAETLADSEITHCCIFNVDQLVRDNWLDWLLVAFEEYPKLGMVGPLIIEEMTPEQYLKHHFPASEAQSDLMVEHRSQEAPHRSKGCPWLFTRECLEALDRDGYYFDPRFEIAQYEDSDMLLRITIKGYDYAKVLNCPAYHYVGSAGQAEARRRLDGRDFALENRIKFEEKWGTIDLSQLMPFPLYQSA